MSDRSASERTQPDGELPDRVVVPVYAETVQITKRRVAAGRVRVHKRVRSVEELVGQDLLHETIAVERVSIGRVVDAAPQPRQEGDTLVIPVLEEVLVVERRLMLKEEIRITKQQHTRREEQTVTLRREEVELERLDEAPDQRQTTESEDRR